MRYPTMFWLRLKPRLRGTRELRITRKIRDWWRSHIALDATTRMMFYKILAAQTRGGVRLLTICRMLKDKGKLDPAVKRLAQYGAEAAQAGRLASIGFAESGYLPSVDAGILRVAEQNGTLPDALAELTDAERQTRTFFSGVFRPAAFQLVPASVAIGMVAASPKLLSEIVQDLAALEAMPLYQVATAMQTFGPTGLMLILLFTGFCWWGRSRLTKFRWLLTLFSRDWLDQVAIAYCRLGASMTRQGATHLQTLTAFADAYSSSYIQTMIPRVQRDVSDGRAYAASLADRLLPVDVAELLEALVPGEDRERYPNAFETLAAMQEAQLANHYAVRARALKFVFMATAAGFLVLMFHGLFNAAQTVASQVGVF